LQVHDGWIEQKKTGLQLPANRLPFDIFDCGVILESALKSERSLSSQVLF
jgi:hypothetical protein